MNKSYFLAKATAIELSMYMMYFAICHATNNE